MFGITTTSKEESEEISSTKNKEAKCAPDGYLQAQSYGRLRRRQRRLLGEAAPSDGLAERKGASSHATTKAQHGCMVGHRSVAAAAASRRRRRLAHGRGLVTSARPGPRARRGGSHDLLAWLSRSHPRSMAQRRFCPAQCGRVARGYEVSVAQRAAARNWQRAASLAASLHAAALRQQTPMACAAAADGCATRRRCGRRGGCPARWWPQGCLPEGSAPFRTGQKAEWAAAHALFSCGKFRRRKK